MAGQLWSINSLGGYMYSDNLSDKLRLQLQPLARFRQFCDAKEAFGTGKGQYFNWNVYSDVQDEGREILETETMPETNFEITQGQLKVAEFGNSVGFTHKLDNLSEQPVTEVINKVLKFDAAKALDRAAYAQFNMTPLRVAPVAGNDPDAVVLETGGASTIVNNIPMGKEHVKPIMDLMTERNIPTYEGQDYMALARTSTLRPLKDDLEAINQYVDAGWNRIMHGEKGRYDGCRFCEQTNIPSEQWANNQSDAVFFFGSDTVAEAFAIPEELRGKIAQDYGRDKGIAWYALLGYGLVHPDAANARIVKWDSA